MIHCPRVSVVIPTYNCDRYLAEAVDSVLAQSYQEYELLVVDDGSTDRTAQVLADYGDRLRYIHQTNQGVAVARNHGLQLARGEFISFLDADDVWLPHKLEAQLAVFDKSYQAGRSIDIVHSGWRRTDESGQSLKDVCPWNTSPTLDLQGWLQWKPVLPSAMMFRRDCLLAVDGFDPRFPPAEDTDLVLRLALNGCQTEWLKDITILYRQHQNSAMQKGLPQARSLTNVLNHFFEMPDLPPAIRRMEKQVRYSTSVWIAWYLYNTCHHDEMEVYLKHSWNYSNNSPIDTIIHWIESFSTFSQSWGLPFDTAMLCQTVQWTQATTWVMNEQ